MREKKFINHKEDIVREADGIIQSFAGFTNGLRTLFLIHRTKEGATSQRTGEHKKMISTNDVEFKDALCTLLEMKYASQNELRIYSCVNRRDIHKAIRKFKFNQLESDFYDEENKLNFYYDIKNRWFSALMNPECKKSSLFLFDCDSEQETQNTLKKLAELDVHIYHQYGTKNGTHIITAPFNLALFEVQNVTVNKDALLLLKY